MLEALSSLAVAVSLTVLLSAPLRAQVPGGGAQAGQPVGTPPANAQNSGAGSPNGPSTARSQPQPSSVLSPGGRQFGAHVSGMAPEHPREHGRGFGDCVSELAVTGVCSHHDHE